MAVITAYAYSDNENYVAVPALEGDNTFTGVQKFIGNTASTSTDTGTVIITGGLGVQGNIYGSRVWGAYWNDIADCIEVPEDTELEPGYCYCTDGQKYYKSDRYLADGIFGVHSDTAGFYVGKKENAKQIKVGVGGFILCYVDKEYPVGTPLTCTEGGMLTKLKEEDISINPHKIVGTYWKSEPSETWGPEGQEVQVNGRKWVKVV